MGLIVVKNCDLLCAVKLNEVTPRTRVRQRIKRLLEDRGFNQRAFAKALGHGDQWATHFFKGRVPLSIDQLDDAARFLRVPPGEIVRESDEGWELKPSEMRVVRALRMLPGVVADHLVTLADYLIGTTPDEVELLRSIRALTEDDRAILERWTHVMARAKAQGLDAAALADLLRTTEPPPLRDTHTPVRWKGKA